MRAGYFFFLPTYFLPFSPNCVKEVSSVFILPHLPSFSSLFFFPLLIFFSYVFLPFSPNCVKKRLKCSHSFVTSFFLFSSQILPSLPNFLLKDHCYSRLLFPSLFFASKSKLCVSETRRSREELHPTEHSEWNKEKVHQALSQGRSIRV